MSHDAEEVLCDKLKNNSFSIQVDESTDFTIKSYVVTFVTFVNDGEIVLSSYLETKGLSWENCVGICTDGAPSVVGSIRVHTSLVKKEDPDITSHCFIHRELLVSKTCRDKMKKVLDDATKMVNGIKQRPFHFRMYKNCVKTWTNCT
jgi:hypothetical protein